MEHPAASQPIDTDFLAILVCPATRKPLRRATTAELAKLGLDAALVREDGLLAYPVRDGIPLLIADAAIPIG